MRQDGPYASNDGLTARAGSAPPATPAPATPAPATLAPATPAPATLAPAAPEQRILGARGLIVFLALLSAFPPLSTDLYLPSLPTMTVYFGVPEYMTNLTLILFFVFFAAAVLIWGPLSDKYGRRPVLLVGLSTYAVAGLLCATSQDINQLILFRVLQAIGGGAATAVGTAIVKDVYHGRRREVVLAVVQSMFVIAPAVAPAVGAILLTFISWRGVFVTQAIVGLGVFAGALAFVETVESRSEVSVGRTLGRLGVVIRNRAFATLLVIFSLTSIAMMSFIASSSYIYQDFFGLSSGTFSLLFAFNAGGMLIGPLLYVSLSGRFRRFTIINACFAVICLSGVLVFSFGRLAPLVFAPLLLPATIATSCLRPPSAFLMLEQQQTDAGSASALMGSFAMIMGSVGMMVVSVFPGSLIQAVGALNITIGAVCGGSWLLATGTPLLRGTRR